MFERNLVTDTKNIIWKEPYQSSINGTNTEARRNIKFMGKLGYKNDKITDAWQKVYGNDAPNKSAVYKCITHFKKWSDSV